MAHDLGAASERRSGKAAAHHLAERDKVGRPRVVGARFELEPTAACNPKARHDLVDDEQGAMCTRDARERSVEARHRGDDPHIGRGRLGDHGGNLVAVKRESRLNGRDVVVGQHDRVVRLGAGDTRGVGQGEGGQARSCSGQKGIDVTVVAASELHDLGAPSETARESDGRHRGLGATTDEPDLLNCGDARHDLLGEQHLTLARGAE
ncbi:unannotated protein [freshwater metagenome]|uniref:Unannotated protein n=1 Tax=freshwater metagenome TaxID=449393 RepID=A0A6J7C298_9ZZZZ